MVDVEDANDVDRCSGIEIISNRSLNQTVHVTLNSNSSWNVTNVSEFLKYCCPECEFKCVGLNEFHKHANEKHKLSIDQP